MLLNDAGKIVSTEWLALPSRFPSIILDEFVVMPNHFHGIIYILPDSIENPTLGKIIGAFKSIVNNNYSQTCLHSTCIECDLDRTDRAE
jgi:putative transposase